MNWWNTVLRFFRLKKLRSAKEEAYRLWFSKALLDHQIDTLQLYKPAYKVPLPKGNSPFKEKG